MTFAWLAYSLCVSLVVGAVSLLLERLLLHWDLTTRGLWATSLLLSAAAPLVALILLPQNISLLGESNAWLSQHLPVPLDAAQLGATRLQFLADYFLPELGPLLSALWTVTATVLFLWLTTSWYRLNAHRRRWKTGEFQGVPCLISEETGPGLVGFFKTRLVIPDWVFRLEDDQQKMVAEHELQHRRRRDPWLLSVGYGMLLLAPWNPVVWWQARRLQLAVEMDCDHRVLEKVGDTKAYGTLLVDLAEHGKGLVTAFSQTESEMVQRIRRLNGSLRPDPFRATLAAAGACLAVLLLWVVPMPVSAPPGPEEVQSVREALAYPTPYTEHPRCLNCEQLGLKTATLQPDSQPRNGQGPSVLVLIYISEEGDVTGYTCSPHCPKESAESTLARLNDLRYKPARVWGVSVPTWFGVQVPIRSS